jgi:hypothetical protein
VAKTIRPIARTSLSSSAKMPSIIQFIRAHPRRSVTFFEPTYSDFGPMQNCCVRPRHVISNTICLPTSQMRTTLKPSGHSAVWSARTITRPPRGPAATHISDLHGSRRIDGKRFLITSLPDRRTPFHRNRSLRHRRRECLVWVPHLTPFPARGPSTRLRRMLDNGFVRLIANNLSPSSRLFDCRCTA